MKRPTDSASGKGDNAVLDETDDVVIESDVCHTRDQDHAIGLLAKPDSIPEGYTGKRGRRGGKKKLLKKAAKDGIPNDEAPDDLDSSPMLQRSSIGPKRSPWKQTTFLVEGDTPLKSPVKRPSSRDQTASMNASIFRGESKRKSQNSASTEMTRTDGQPRRL
jgi:hypothetical protein